jgi:hypothetical protein
VKLAPRSRDHAHIIDIHDIGETEGQSSIWSWVLVVLPSAEISRTDAHSAGRRHPEQNGRGSRAPTISASCIAI